MSLYEKINEGIKEAMRQKDMLRLEVLRMLKSKILAVDARGNLADSDILKLFKTYSGNLQEAIEQAIAANRNEMVEKLKLEREIVLEFLPKTLSFEDTEKLVKKAIEEQGLKSKKEFGLVMKYVIKHSQAIDAKLVKEIAESILD
jgi:uncharacterized protein YqeY